MADLCNDQVPEEKNVISGRRWIAAAMLALVLHGTAVAMVINWTAATPPLNPPATVTIDLALSAMAPDVPEQDKAPGPQMTEAQPQQSTQPHEDESEQLKLPNDPAAEIALPPPSNLSVRKPQTDDKKVETEKPSPSQKHAAPRTTAPKTAPVEHADRMAAPSRASTGTSSMSPDAWKGLVSAHLNRLPINSGSSMAVATVAFVIDRSGRVLSASLRRSSGNAALDAEAVALPRRASPVPAPPETVRGNTITVDMPVRVH